MPLIAGNIAYIYLWTYPPLRFERENLTSRSLCFQQLFLGLIRRSTTIQHWTSTNQDSSTAFRLLLISLVFFHLQQSPRGIHTQYRRRYVSYALFSEMFRTNTKLCRSLRRISTKAPIDGSSAIPDQLEKFQRFQASKPCPRSRSGGICGKGRHILSPISLL